MAQVPVGVWGSQVPGGSLFVDCSRQPRMRMYECRLCSVNPFSALFRPQESRESEQRRAKQATRTNSSSRRSEDFQRRSEEEVRATVRQWEQYAHPRSREFFRTPEALAEVLMQLARATDKNHDCVLGPEERCVHWHGDITDGHAVMRMVKPSESSESVTYVNRVLAFIFATDESFAKLIKLPKEPFRMSCDDQLCIHLGHILLNTHAAGRPESDQELEEE
uniref:Uncharacterized protein n=1 Tax=Alexandrium monilatum TaxID=311494 RepID=A0A7S4Q8I3_9DINO